MQDTHVLDTLKVNSYVSSMDHDIFIDEDIENEAYYRSVISTLNKASEKDTLRFIISSNGGFGSTAMTLAHAMDSCPAKKVGILCGNVKSAATIIALHCDDWEVGAGCDWLAHTASFGVGGEAHKVKKHHDHEQELVKRLLFREYKGFYTEEEIQSIADGNDSQLFEEDVIARLQNFVQHKQSQQSTAMEEMFALQNEQSSQYESILMKRLVEKGEISQEEADVALKVQNASLVLDEEEGDMLFQTLGDAGEGISPEDTPELKVVDVNGCTWKVDFSEDEEGETMLIEVFCEDTMQDFLCNSIYLSDGYSLDELKSLADLFEITYQHNIGKTRIANKIVEFFELEVIEFLDK